VSEYGYDGLELRLLDGEPIDPLSVDDAARRAVPTMLTRSGVPLSSLDTSIELARPFERLDKQLGRVSSNNLLSALTRNKTVQDGWFAIINGNWIAVTLDVERKVLAHHAETNQPNFCA